MPKFDEYLAEMSRSDKQEVENRMAQALEHLLKLHDREIPESIRARNRRGWQDSIQEQRRRILRLVTRHPGLKPLLRDLDWEEIHQAALRSLEVDYLAVDFPRTCLSRRKRLWAMRS